MDTMYIGCKTGLLCNLIFLSRSLFDHGSFELFGVFVLRAQGFPSTVRVLRAGQVHGPS